MKQMSYEDILKMVYQSCNSVFRCGIEDNYYDDIIKSATQIYIAQLKTRSEAEKLADKIRVAYIDSDNPLGYKEKDFLKYSDFTKWLYEESNKGRGLKLIGMTFMPVDIEEG